MSYQITSQPATEPITTAEAKTHLRVDFSTDDTYIDSIISASRKFVEQYTNRALITQTWRLNLNSFTIPFELPINPVVSVTSIKYYDVNDVQQTLSASNYQVDILGDVAKIYEGVSVGFPAISESVINPIEVIFVAGYGSASAVPVDIKHAIKILVSYFYENREMVNVPMQSIATDIKMPMVVNILLNQYKVRNFG